MARRFDWRARERAINTFPHYRANVEGTTVHFVHVRARGSGSIPLLLTHGWPSSFLEYLPLVPLLTDAFDVVVPSLPGYAFSAPLPPGDSDRIPTLWARLMTDVLGYDRFAAYGGDIGGMVTNRLGLEFAERLIGLVTSFVAEPYLGPGSRPLSDADRAFLYRRRATTLDGANASWHVQSTRPQTVAVGLTDSPAGLAAWLVDKWREWSDCDGDIERRFSKDELLTLLTLYWVTGTIGSSFQIYADWQLGQTDDRSTSRVSDERVQVPAGVVLFAVARWPREWAERSYADLRRFVEMPRGGHFGALEERELLADELLTFFSRLR